MPFMPLVRGDKSSEAGVLLDEKLLSAMGKYNLQPVSRSLFPEVEGLVGFIRQESRLQWPPVEHAGRL